MSKEELLTLLANLKQVPDFELAHTEADRALIAYINDPDIAAAYAALTKWYA